jgi:adenine-specific DNA-methyltransferase
LIAMNITRRLIIRPFFEAGGVTLYCDDCLRVMRRLGDHSVDLVFADPPFNVGKEYEVNMPLSEYYIWCDQWVRAASRVLTLSGAMWMMTIQEHVGRMMQSMAGLLHFRNMVIWHNSSMPVKNRFCIGYQPLLWYVKDSENYTFNFGVESRNSTAALPWGRKNKTGSLKDIWDDIPFVSGGCMASKEAIFRPGTKKKAHQAQMPLKLARRIVNYCTNPGDTVLDLFCRSGTMAIACMELGRKFIGVEKAAGYCELIQERVVKALNAPEPCQMSLDIPA